MEQTERCLWKRWIDTFGECNSIYTHKHKHANRVADTHVSPCFLYIDWATRVCLLNIETNIYANICAEKGRANVEWHTQRVRCGWIFSTCSNNKNKSTLLDTIFTVASPFTNFHSVSTNISVQIYLKLLNFFIIVVTAWVLYFPLVVEIKKKHNYFLFFYSVESTATNTFNELLRAVTVRCLHSVLRRPILSRAQHCTFYRSRWCLLLLPLPLFLLLSPSMWSS